MTPAQTELLYQAQRALALLDDIMREQRMWWLEDDALALSKAITAAQAEQPMAVPVAEARDHLGAALAQTIDTDDPIIVGHVRTAHALLSDV